MPRNKQICSKACIAGMSAMFALAALGQQKGGAPVAAPPNQQILANMAQQQALLSQNSPQQPSPRPGQANGPLSLNQGDDLPPNFQEQARLKRNDERQRKLESDTGRLLALANLLKSEIKASGSESMTPEMLRQMDEIEKLARSVKERMRN